MGKIFVIMGPSCSGKDTLYKELKDYYGNVLKSIVLHTTRPMRKGEVEGKTYYFINDEKFEEMQKNNEIAEYRLYDTAHGVWIYATASIGIDLDNNDYLTINTLEGYKSLKEYYGEDKIVPLYIQVDEDVRHARAEVREKQQEKPDYEQMEKRFKNDSKDFTIEKRDAAGIPESNIFTNIPNASENTISTKISEITTTIPETIPITTIPETPIITTVSRNNSYFFHSFIIQYYKS